MKIPCYCELEFLKRFTNDIPKTNPYSNGTSDFDIWRNFKKLIFENSRLTVDNSNKLREWVKEDRKNPLAVILFKKINEINEMLIDEINLETINPHTIFFLTNTQRCEQLEKKHGMLFVSKETQRPNGLKLFNEEIVISINKRNKIKNWDNILKNKLPCNSMIIVDNYLFESKRKIKQNLIKLLSKLLPDELNSVFQLQIITEKPNDPKTIPDFFWKLPKELSKSYKIDLKIIYDTATEAKKHHDRNIITNYLWINSGRGFSIFETVYKEGRGNVEQVSHNTHFFLLAIPRNGIVYDMVNSLKKDYKELEYNPDENHKKYLKEHVMPKEKAGEITNRLLKINAD